MQPALSVVIVNYNYGRYLESAILSVLNQSGFEKCELIVVDGGSTDNSLEIIKKYAKRISWWCSEPDNGQSDAFNKGFSHAKGKYLTWLNADDVFVPNCLVKVLQSFENNPKCEWFTANALFFQNGGHFCRLIWGPHWLPNWLQRKDSPVIAFGPSTFFSKRILEVAGGVDDKLYYTMDTELWIRFIKHGIRQRRINAFVWAFRLHEASKTSEFDQHRVQIENKKKIAEESAYAERKNRYAESWFLHFLIYLLRILDGSYIWGVVMTLWLSGRNLSIIDGK